MTRSREVRGLDRKQLCYLISRPYRTLHAWETGEHRPPLSSLTDWCVALDLSPLERAHALRLRRLAGSE